MDPALALRRWRHAVAEGLEEEAYSAAGALVAWLDRGGARPRGLREDELRALYADARAGRSSGRAGVRASSTYGKLVRRKGPRGVLFDFVLTEDATRKLGFHRDQDGKRPTVKERGDRERMRDAVAARLGEKVQGSVVRLISIAASLSGWAPWVVDVVDERERAGHAVGFQYDPSFIEEPWVKQAVARAKWKTARKKAAAKAAEKMRRLAKGYR